MNCQNSITKIAADDILIFYFYLSKERRLDFHVNPLFSVAEDSFETSSLSFSEKHRKNIYKCRLLQS